VGRQASQTPEFLLNAQPDLQALRPRSGAHFAARSGLLAATQPESERGAAR
jgi:hypothetical protein